MSPDASLFEEILEEDSGIWLSIGDLMSGLLLVFVLLFVAAILRLQSFIEESQERRIVIIQALQEKLDEHEIEAELDAETGDISIMDSVLFDVGQSHLKGEGQAFLSDFIPIYSEVIFSDPHIEEEVVRVIIEGHTSSEGSDATNMSLSLSRADSVVQYILGDMDFETRPDFMLKVMAAGRGEIEAVQSDNEPSDSKVVFRIKFKGEDFKAWARRGRIDP